MSKTVVGLFSTMAEANKARQELITDGYESHNIHVMANDEGPASSSAPTANESGYTDIGSGGGTGIGEKISSFFRSLSGGDDHAHDHYAKGVNAGGALLAITVPDEEAAEAATFLKQVGARDIEGGSSSQYQGSAKTAAEGVAIPIVEEELVVGKREVDRGGVRIYSHVVERPVDADINLREEQINVERRAVNRPATAADFAAGSGSVIELNATGEEAVVGKTSRVVEEVLVGKQSSERTQAIHDSVRKTEVDVEEVPGETTGAGISKDRY
ncbi:YsnF/AvaK domain-containing protein [Granulicella sibirica]|uniref:DUF2382 domain-containing protein n=1 Tax=Granulicella sibirica TaxID=2479048 RepID=A0A4Q0STF9_9BACT|nr:DUF2382 domain-containing protein [Granulicella sibirica]RXH53967.1 hypothetical protein GRAN_4936 [Granulicella sibirica]